MHLDIVLKIRDCCKFFVKSSYVPVFEVCTAMSSLKLKWFKACVVHINAQNDFNYWFMNI